MKRLFMLFAILSVCCTISAQRKCSACNGTGTVVRSISVSRYGLSNDYWVKCSTCGKKYLKSVGHSHITCKHCGGTGYIGSSSSSGSGGSASDKLNEIAIANPQAYNAAMTIKYGLKMSTEEAEEINKLDEYNAKQYMKWRNLLNGYTTFANRSLALGQILGDVKVADNMKANYDSQLQKLTPTFSVTTRLKQISDQLYKKYQNAYTVLRAREASKQQLNNVQNRLLDLQLYGPLW